MKRLAGRRYRVQAGCGVGCTREPSTFESAVPSTRNETVRVGATQRNAPVPAYPTPSKDGAPPLGQTPAAHNEQLKDWERKSGISNYISRHIIFPISLSLILSHFFPLFPSC